MRIALPALVALACMACPPAFAGADCKCRANGHAYEQGQIMCILGRLSQCQMNQNVPAWLTIAPDCPEVELKQTPPPPPHDTAQLIR